MDENESQSVRKEGEEGAADKASEWGVNEDKIRRLVVLYPVSVFSFGWFLCCRFFSPAKMSR